MQTGDQDSHSVKGLKSFHVASQDSENRAQIVNTEVAPLASCVGVLTLDLHSQDSSSQHRLHGQEGADDLSSASILSDTVADLTVTSGVGVGVH